MNNYSKIKEFLANKELPSYLNIANTVGNQAFILKYKSQLGDFANFIAEQSKLAPKFKNKLPQLYQAGGYITARGLEQCTAEAVANYKAQLIKNGTLLTLASGIGIDDMALAKTNSSVVSVDPDTELNELACYNFELLGLRNITRLGLTAESFLATNHTTFDAVYIDPDRRDGEQRQLLLSEHQPNVIALMPDLLKISKQVWIKCSPLYDIDMALHEMNGITAIHVISHKGEVKEMLLKIENNAQSEAPIYCTDIGSQRTQTEEFTSMEMPMEAETLAGYFYEAGASLVKARCHQTYAAELNLKWIDKTVPFYVGAKAHEDFMGKCLLIKACLALNPKQIKMYLKSIGTQQINIKARGVKCDVPALFKTIGIKEGGEEFLFLTPFKGKQMALHCIPL